MPVPLQPFGFSRRLIAMAGVGAVTVAGCVACGSAPRGPANSSGVNVKASDTACVAASTTFMSGTQTFAVSNVGSQVTEFVVYAPGDRVVGEVGNIGPSAGKRLTVALKAGEYDLACRPGRSGKGIRTPIVVKAPSGEQPSTSPELDAAVATYRSYVVAQAQLLQTRSKPFIEAVQSGDLLKAIALYPSARVPYDAIAPVAASFGDLDARIDARIDDVEVGQQWTGFHRLEHDLWKTSDISRDGPVAQQLQADIAKLVDQVQRIDLSADQIATGAVSTLKQVAAVTLAGDQERYSHLDLTDANANVQGAHHVYDALRPIVAAQDPELVVKVDTRFATLEEDLAQYNLGATFAAYDDLLDSQTHQLASDVNALLGPMAQVASVIQKA